MTPRDANEGRSGQPPKPQPQTHKAAPERRRSYPKVGGPPPSRPDGPRPAPQDPGKKAAESD